MQPCVYIKLHVSYTNAFNSITIWIILVSSPCLSVIHFNSKNSGSHHQPPIYLISTPIYMYSDFTTGNSHSHGKQFCQLKYSSYIVFQAFTLIVSTHFFSYLEQHHSLKPLQRGYFMYVQYSQILLSQSAFILG